MLEPDKFTDPYNCIIYNSYIILNLLKKRGSAKLQYIRNELIRLVGRNAESLLIPAIEFLYLLGEINYKIIDDIVEWNHENK